MRTLAAIPVKSFGAAKQRLSEALGERPRRALAMAMLCDVLVALREVEGIDEIVVVTADAEAEAIAVDERARVLWQPGDTGHVAAALVGVEHALASGRDRVLLLPGDTPLLDPLEIDALLDRAAERELGLAILPDRHGSGTNGLLIHPPDAVEPSFGPGSCERHAGLARDAGVTWSVEALQSLTYDVDTPEDLVTLAAELERGDAPAPLTRATLRQLERGGHLAGLPAPA